MNKQLGEYKNVFLIIYGDNLSSDPALGFLSADGREKLITLRGSVLDTPKCSYVVDILTLPLDVQKYITSLVKELKLTVLPLPSINTLACSKCMLPLTSKLRHLLNNNFGLKRHRFTNAMLATRHVLDSRPTSVI